MERNVKLFPLYRLFSYDVLFYYAISTVYFIEVKHLSLSEIALLSTAYSAANVILQVPAAMIADKIGTKLGMIIGNILCVLWGINLITANSYQTLAIGEVLCALGFSIKSVCEAPFLLSSLKKLGRTNDYAKLESKGSALYFIVEAIACVVSGYLYNINVYLPIIFICLCSLIPTIIAINFQNINKSSESISTKKYFSDLTSGFKFIFKSKRLHAMLLFSCIFFGVISLSDVFRKAYFTEFNLSSTGFGYAYAIFAVFAAIGSKIQDKIEKKHKNRTLTFFSITYIGLLIFAGIIALFNLTDNILINIGIVLFSAQHILKGAYRVIIKEYITRYTTSSIRSKLMSIFFLSERIGATIFTAISSLLLASYTIGISSTITGFVLIILMVLVLQYMHPRMGLSPDTYTSRDRFDLIENKDSE